MRTAIAPSPTAEATRLIEPERTSPAANTPGRLVSSGSGHPAGGVVDRDDVQRFVPMQLADLGAEVDLDRRVRLDPVQEVAEALHGASPVG